VKLSRLAIASSGRLLRSCPYRSPAWVPIKIAGMPVPLTTPAQTRRHLPRKRVPTPQLPECGLRDNLATHPKFPNAQIFSNVGDVGKRWPGVMGGSELALDNGQPGYTGLRALPSDRVPARRSGREGRREGGREGNGSGAMAERTASCGTFEGQVIARKRTKYPALDGIPLLGKLRDRIRRSLKVEAVQAPLRASMRLDHPWRRPSSHGPFP
jgi:hypothetical protein